ncbi:hypothetical protein BVG16_26790 [Paenibacillus selenitireducens]|uniref:Uncharacterized protein n=1 Tax=Paenibacillus selenitireducens TaxID=1324314 RepID=A0A1T2X2A2_9BACL|nr:hypothetical protein [Paenibacillus selenitireducens]OPA73703.1 hypothetical protein BVG16_26790 [Paenibacillus selenitireducens]
MSFEWESFAVSVILLVVIVCVIVLLFRWLLHGRKKARHTQQTLERIEAKLDHLMKEEQEK